MLYVTIWFVCGLIAAYVYANKGRSPITAFLVGLLFGPIGVILALLTSPNHAKLEQSQIASGQQKKCPHCAELIRSDARFCRYCQREVAS